MPHIILKGKIEDIIDTLVKDYQVYRDESSYVVLVPMGDLEVLLKIVERKEDIMIAVINSSYLVNCESIQNLLIKLLKSLGKNTSVVYASIPKRLLRSYGITNAS